MVRWLALFALLIAAPALAEDASVPPRLGYAPVSARAEVTVTILRGEEIRPLARRDGAGQAVAPTDRQYQHLPSDQIRIDFY